MSVNKLFILLAFSFQFFANSCLSQLAPRPEYFERPRPVRPDPQPIPNNEVKIQVAILLDCSNSMDGLIEQAKSRLWNIVNTMTTLKHEGAAPKIEIALYQYGNDNLNAETNWVKQVLPFTSDLDLISEKLFSLTTNGGEEYCGAAINHANYNLQWSGNDKSMKLMYIAGNEPFNQGDINYKDVVAYSRRNKIFVNTIYCGDINEGIRTFWQDGAISGNGNFFHINPNEKVQYVQTPYDQQISDANTRLNSTYMGYGDRGEVKKASQVREDNNAGKISQSNKVERAVSKSKVAVYDNSSWDLVDKVAQAPQAISQLSESELPQEMKGKSEAEKKQIVAKKAEDRKKIQSEIESLGAKRQKYIEEESKKSATTRSNDLGKAMEESILETAGGIGYKVK